MGYELNKLMQQYGVSTPSLQRYSGAAAPGTAPVAPTAYTGTDKNKLNSYNAALNTYNTNKAAYDAATEAHKADTAAYDAYKQDYFDRIGNTPMYLDAQYQTTPRAASPTDVSGLYQRYLNRTPSATEAADWNTKFGEQISPMERSQFVQAAMPELQQRGMNTFGNQFYQDTGSYWGNQLRAPAFSNAGVENNAANVGVAGTTGPNGQNLEYRQGLRGYYTPEGTYRPPSLGVAGITTQYVPGLPQGAVWDPGKKTYFVPFAKGGDVKTNYSDGDLVRTYPYGQEKLPNPTDLPDITPAAIRNISPGFITGAMTPTDTSGAPTAMQPQPRAAATAQPAMPSNMEAISGMLSRYFPDNGGYKKELNEARATAKSKSEAFSKMLREAMTDSEAAPSKEEMYWRLAEAFGSPTRTGAFSENLAMASKGMAEYKKSERETKVAQSNLRKQLALKGAELEMTGAKEDLATIRTLAAEGMKDKREIVKTMMTKFIESGQPQSTAGKQAKDEGFVPGTPEFQSRTAELYQTTLDAQAARIEALVGQLAIAGGNLAVSRERLETEKEKGKKLTPAEVKLKTDTEDLLAAANQSLKDIQQAYKLNPNTFDSSLLDTAQRKLLENTASNDPKVVATRTLENLLSKDAIGKLRASFGGNPTEGERAILLQLEGINSKSKEERAAIMRNAYEALKASIARHQKRLNEINAGLYRDTDKSGGLE